MGVWRLRRYTTQYEGDEPFHPLGDDALGYIVYTADGHMSGTMQRARPQPFALADRLRATPAEKARAFDDYVTYCGRYRVDGDRVLHRIEASLMPNWIGQEQERHMRWQGDDRVALEASWVVDGRRRVAVVEWERVRAEPAA